MGFGLGGVVRQERSRAEEDEQEEDDEGRESREERRRARGAGRAKGCDWSTHSGFSLARALLSRGARAAENEGAATGAPRTGSRHRGWEGKDGQRGGATGERRARASAECRGSFCFARARAVFEWWGWRGARVPVSGCVIVRRPVWSRRVVWRERARGREEQGLFVPPPPPVPLVAADARARSFHLPFSSRFSLHTHNTKSSNSSP